MLLLRGPQMLVRIADASVCYVFAGVKAPVAYNYQIFNTACTDSKVLAYQPLPLLFVFSWPVTNKICFLSSDILNSFESSPLSLIFCVQA